jgi:NADPH2:quinone reductase
MANLSVLGVLLAYLDVPRDFRRFGINPFPPATGQRVHAALLELVAAGSIRPVVGRRIGLDDVAAALEDHAARRTSGRTVVQIGATP